MTNLLELFSIANQIDFASVMIVFLAIALKYTWRTAHNAGTMNGLEHALDAVEEALEMSEEESNTLYLKMSKNVRSRLTVVDTVEE